VDPIVSWILFDWCDFIACNTLRSLITVTIKLSHDIGGCYWLLQDGRLHWMKCLKLVKAVVLFFVSEAIRDQLGRVLVSPIFARLLLFRSPQFIDACTLSCIILLLAVYRCSSDRTSQASSVVLWSSHRPSEQTRPGHSSARETGCENVAKVTSI